jgi:hypothetical protein
MSSYQGESGVHAGGFDYIQEKGYGHELFNFLRCEDGFCYGYLQARSKTININRLGADDEDTYFNGVTVLWTATRPNGGRVIVGGYRAARIYRTMQTGGIKGRQTHGERVGHYAEARQEDTVLIPVAKRDFAVPHHGKGLPGQSLVFYPEDSEAPEMKLWLPGALEHISAWHEKAENGSVHDNKSAGRRWPSPPDAAHNAAVEAEAIAFVKSRLGSVKRDRQPHNCGWDLEFAQGSGTLCVEVKGLSGAELGVELSPNEYQAMKRVMTGDFPEGEYRLAVVRNALTNPELFLFAHGGGKDWICERTSTCISVMERAGARLA